MMMIMMNDVSIHSRTSSILVQMSSATQGQQELTCIANIDTLILTQSVDNARANHQSSPNWSGDDVMEKCMHAGFAGGAVFFVFTARGCGRMWTDMAISERLCKGSASSSWRWRAMR